MSTSSLRLMRAGLVPLEQIDLLTIGQSVLRAEAERALVTLASKSAAEPLFVNGEWGTGKTHSLAYMRSVVEKSGYATASIVLDARTSAPTHPQRLHPLLARDLRSSGNHGLRSVLPPLLEDRALVRRIVSGNCDRSLVDVCHALDGLASLIEAGETARIGAHWGWRLLTGADFAGSDYAYRRERALERIAWTARALFSLGAGGLAIFLDELETIDQLWNRRSRAVAYETLGRLSVMPHVWCVFGITERFLRVVYDDARSEVYTNSRESGQAFLKRWRHAEVRMIAPPSIARTDAHRLAQRVSALYRQTYEVGVVPDQHELIQRWLQGATLNPRRLVRAIVDAHDRARPLRGVTSFG